MIVNELAVATLQKDIQVSSTIVRLNDGLSRNINQSTKTVFLQADSIVESFCGFYTDERLLGKHFRVSTLADPSLSRHYTICNVLQPQVYTHYLQAL